MKEERSENQGEGRESFIWGPRGERPREAVEREAFDLGLERPAGSEYPITCHLIDVPPTIYVQK